MTAPLASNVWSFAGESDRADINHFLLQYFINYNFGQTGWYLVSEPIMTADWTRDDGDGGSCLAAVVLGASSMWARNP